MSPAAASATTYLIRRRCGGLLDPLMRRALSTQTLTQLDTKQTQSQSQIQTSSHSGNLDLGQRSFSSQALTRPTNKVMGGRVPCLLLPSQTNPHSCSVFTLSGSGDGKGRNDNFFQYEREIDLPRNADPTAKSCFIGSTEGILFTTPRKEKSTEMLAFDPLTRTLLRLPSPDTLAYYPDVYCLQKAKALLSPSRDILVINHIRKAEYARWGPQGWGSWRTLPEDGQLHEDDDEDCVREREPVHDFIFHKGLLYSVDSLGTLTIYDFNNPSSSSEEEEKEPSFSLSGSPELRRYGEDYHTSCLVESPDGNDLFLVYRLDLSEFMVFKLNSEGNWARVSTIGDMAIFMGINQSVSLQATDFPDILKPNSIYFTERNPHLNSHAGVFSLEDESHQFFKFTTSCQDVYNWRRWEQPVWFMPATTS